VNSSQRVVLAVGLLSLLPRATTLAQAPAPNQDPVYTNQGELMPPNGYREWVYLSTGMNMSYLPRSSGTGRDVFSNVFVNPESYRAFQRTGTWPDKTQLVLEIRAATNKGSINQDGFYQNADIRGFEVHVKDTTRFQGGWAFFGFDENKPAKLIPLAETCYSCHRDHAAVDTTFVQFYPTLLPVAKQNKTLSAAYQAEQARMRSAP
jgi:hypothetical protein